MVWDAIKSAGKKAAMGAASKTVETAKQIDEDMKEEHGSDPDAEGLGMNLGLGDPGQAGDGGGRERGGIDLGVGGMGGGDRQPQMPGAAMGGGSDSADRRPQMPGAVMGDDEDRDDDFPPLF